MTGAERGDCARCFMRCRCQEFAALEREQREERAKVGADSARVSVADDVVHVASEP